MKKLLPVNKRTVSAWALGLALLGGAGSVYAQNTPTAATGAVVQRVTQGQKMTVRGVLLRRNDDQSFVLQDETGSELTFVLAPNASIKTNGGIFGGGRNLAPSNLLRGLSLKVEGRGDSQGRLEVNKVRFDESEFRVARSIGSRVDPVEGRVSGTETRISEVEESARRTSGQLDELVAVSNAARGGARAAQETADAAVQGVNATNQRIGDIDNYVPQDVASIMFRTGSSTLSPEAKLQLDDLAAKAAAASGYLIEVTGYTDAQGNVDRNRVLSQRRAENVIRYLLENHQIPLRRIVPSYGYGETNAVADNKTREGRAQNRRVEVKILVSRGLTQPAQTLTTGSQQPE